MKVIKQQVKKLIEWGLRRYVKVVYTLEKRGGEKRKSLNIEDIIKKAADAGYDYKFPYDYSSKKLVVDSFVDLSIIIPVYKVEDYLDECICSVLRQETNYSYEVILVDDGSPDKCGIICDGYALKNDKIKVIHQKNRGVSSARNAGLEQATGKYITFLDADDFLEPTYIQLLMDRALETDADMVKCNFYKVYSDGKKTVEHRYDNIKKEYQNGLGEDMLYLAFPWGSVFKRKMWVSVRFPEGYKHEDMMMAHLIFHEVRVGAYVGLPLYNYRLDNVNSLTKEYGRNIALPRQLDQVFLAYATLEFMYHENMKVDANILKVTLREMGMMTFCRLNKRYHLVAFQLASYTLHRLIDKMPKGYEKELTQIEIVYIYSFQNARYDIWKALICMEYYENSLKSL